MKYCNLNNYNDSFDKARKIILDAKNNYQFNCCCIPTNSIVGPIGPTGPTGLTPNFDIGTVTTGAPGTDATVTIKKV